MSHQTRIMRSLTSVTVGHRKTVGLEQPRVQEMHHVHTDLGPTLYIRIYTPNYRALDWTEVWEAFSKSYPNRWAIQAFPPADRLMDEQNIYHLLVFDQPDAPRGFDLNKR